jgi:hypothetical protein
LPRRSGEANASGGYGLRDGRGRGLWVRALRLVHGSGGREPAGVGRQRALCGGGRNPAIDGVSWRNAQVSRRNPDWNRPRRGSFRGPARLLGWAATVLIRAFRAPAVPVDALRDGDQRGQPSMLGLRGCVIPLAFEKITGPMSMPAGIVGREIRQVQPRSRTATGLGPAASPSPGRCAGFTDDPDGLRASLPPCSALARFVVRSLNRTKQLSVASGNHQSCLKIRATCDLSSYRL